jgi:hypothetical protein
VRVRLEGINTVRKRLGDGTVKTYYYHRATGLRLVGLPGSPEFIASYGDAEKAMRDRHAGSTLNALIRAYTLSIEFQQRLAPSTQTEYRRMLTAAEAEFGDMPIAALDDPRVRKDFLDWREKVARKSGEREADNRLSAISAMLTWATDRGQVVANHLRGFRRLYHVDRSEIIWLPEHIAAFIGGRLHTPTGRFHHWAFAQDRSPHPGAIPRANARACRAGDFQLRELFTNKICKPTANRNRRERCCERETGAIAIT